MNSSVRDGSFVIAALVAAAGLTLGAQPRPSAKPAVPRAERTVPFQVGETLTYDVSWSSYVTAGTATAIVKEKKPSYNSTAYYIVAEGRPTPLVATLYTLYYKLDTLLDVYTLLPQRASAYTEEGKRHKYRITQFDRAKQQADFEAQSATTSRTAVKTPPDVQDALSALYVLRAVPLKVGYRLAMPVWDDGTNFRMSVRVEASERLKTPLGDVTAFRIRPTIVDDDGKPIGRNVSVWITDDARRLPVRIEADLPVGSFTLTLRSAS